jgi:hypothetical protein
MENGKCKMKKAECKMQNDKGGLLVQTIAL